MNIIIDDNMKNRIKDFVADFKNTAEDPDIDLWQWCYDAIDLLEEVLGNK